MLKPCFLDKISTFLHHSQMLRVLEMWCKFQHYNNFCKKKKKLPVKAASLRAHSIDLFSLLQKAKRQLCLKCSNALSLLQLSETHVSLKKVRWPQFIHPCLGISSWDKCVSNCAEKGFEATEPDFFLEWITLYGIMHCRTTTRTTDNTQCKCWTNYWAS